MLKTVNRYVLAATLAAAAGYGSVAAQAATDGTEQKHTCVPLQQIDETPVINDQTILIKMKGGDYKRVDLVSRCMGLKLREGFAHKTWSNDFCTSDTVRVNEPAGATCMIDKIVDIDKTEATKLLAQK